MSAVTGTYHELDNLVKRVAAIAGEGSEFHAGMLKACGIAALSALDGQFIASVDPYGKAWAPLKSGRGAEAEMKRLEQVFGIEIDRTGKPLQDTGRLASSFTSRVIPLGFAIETNVAYAGTHQRGATIVPVTARTLAWKVRGGGWRFAKKVTIPRRQMVPEAETGGMGEWGAAVNEEADAFMQQWFKQAK